MEGVTISPVNIQKRQEIGIRAGDTVRVSQKIQEKGKTRIQVFEGLVLCRKHGNEPGATFTVRKVSSGVGVEKTFPLYSPLIDKIEIVRRSKVRRAKLYFIREKVAREIRRQMRNMRMVDISTGSDIEEKETAEKEKIAAEEAAKAAESAKAAEEASEKDTDTSAQDDSDNSDDSKKAPEAEEDAEAEEAPEKAPEATSEKEEKKDSPSEEKSETEDK